MLAITGEFGAVVVDIVSMVLDVKSVVLRGLSSSLIVPITQYDLLVLRPWQVVPGFGFLRPSTDSP